MNKRLERVENARIGLSKIIREMHDARFDGGDMLISLEDGKVFFIQGFTTRESYDKALAKAKTETIESTNHVEELYFKAIEAIHKYSDSKEKNDE